MANWCKNCGEQHNDWTIVEEIKNKRGRYYPYRDTMDAEYYTYTERSLKCNRCGEIIKQRIDRKELSWAKTNMEKYGYRGANYGT